MSKWLVSIFVVVVMATVLITIPYQIGKSMFWISGCSYESVPNVGLWGLGIGILFVAVILVNIITDVHDLIWK